MALTLSLKPHEKISINGAVIVNGDRRATIQVANRAAILREGDIMRPEDATSPARRIYLPIVMAILEPQERNRWREEFAARLTEFAGASQNPDALAICARMNGYFASGEAHKALRQAKKLIRYEDEALKGDPLVA